MSSSAKAKAVRFDQDSMWVDLSDGRMVGVPLAWFPRLLRATEEQRREVRITNQGLHWEALDEDISVAGQWPAQAMNPTIRELLPPERFAHSQLG